MVQYVTAQNDIDLQGILDLQQANLARHISMQEALEQGFVTVEHDLDLLRAMNLPHPHIIAKAAGKVVGYALIMLPSLKHTVPVLFDMFGEIENIVHKDKNIMSYDYFVMGQVCVAKEYRGQGVFAGLYQTLQSKMAPYYSLVVTEVAFRNTRSMHAHKKVGFKVVKDYFSDSGEHWAIVVWDISS